MLLFLLSLGAAGIPFPAAQEILPSGITCCDEEKIRLAMTEEALARILHKTGPAASGDRQESDYLSEQAYEKIKKRLPAGSSHEQRLAFMRQWLRLPAVDRDMEEFQTLVGYFVLGMSLEIGSTLQDEYDQVVSRREKSLQWLAELEKLPRPDSKSLAQTLFRLGLSQKKLLWIRTMERKWRNVPAGSSPFDEFSILKKNMTGRAADPGRHYIFCLSGRYRSQFSFLDEFLENYRRSAADFRAAARRINEHLEILEE